MQKLIYYILIIYFFVSSFSFSSEIKIWNNWYFGRRAGITFNTPDKMPVPLKDGQINTLEGCASISDTNGNLLFYTNGVSVYNKKGDIMPNGNGLNGHYSSTQSALIVKRPKSQNIYHIFTTDKGPYEGDSPHDLSMTTVDMELDSGRGDVTYKNYMIHSPVVEKLTAIQHSNGYDFWILSRGMNDNKFIVSLLTEGGLVSTKTFETGPIYYPFPASPEFSLGQLKANPNGDMLATVVYGANNIELYKFDNSNGTIIEYLGIPVNEQVTALYGLEFSTNNKFLYVNNLYGRIYQYDVSEFDSLKIQNSMKMVFDSLDYNFQKFGQFQLAPNGRIYMALSYDTLLAAIHKPNVPHPYCNYQPRDVGLAGRISLFGLPNNVITGIYYTLDIYGRSICANLGDSLEMFSIVYPEDINYKYDWTGPNGFKSNLPNPKIYNADKNANGKYICKVTVDDKLFKSDSINLFVYDIPKSEILGSKSICPPEKLKLSSKFQSPEYTYKWSDGSSGSELIISSPGKYYLIVSNPAGCRDSSFIEVINNDNLNIIFDGKPKLCKGSIVTLSLSKDLYDPIEDYTFNWSNGSNKLTTTIFKPGWYSVTVVRAGGCSGIDSIYIEEVEQPGVSLNVSGTIKLCKGDSITLEPKSTSSGWSYEWSDNFNSNNFKRTVKESGIYTIIVKNKGACADSASVEVIFENLPDLELEFSNSKSFCFGDSIIVKPKFIRNDYNYRWNNGIENPIITIKESGSYSLYVTNSTGCKDSIKFDIYVAPQQILNIISDKLFICLNDSVTMSANNRYSKYLWSTGDTTDFIRVYKSGTYKLYVENNLGCPDSAYIEIKSIDFSSKLSKQFIKADSICQGEVFNQIVKIDYYTNDELIINDIVYSGDLLYFDLEDSIEKISENNYQQIVDFRLGNNLPGRYFGELTILVDKPCTNQFSIPVEINIYSNFLFEVNDIESLPGDSVCITIDVSRQCGSDSETYYAPEFDLKLPRLYFYPSKSIGCEIKSNDYKVDDRILHIQADSQTFPINTKRRMEVCGLILSAQKNKAQIEILNPDWKNNNVNSILSNGSIKVDGCSQDLRVLQIFKPISISVNPNPANSFFDITINSQENGKHFVEIYSIEGRQIHNFELNNFKSLNTQTIKINTQELDQGMYQLVVKSPWNVLSSSIFVVKN